MSTVNLSAINLSDLQLFRRIIARELAVLVDSYAIPGEDRPYEGAPADVHRDYAQMRRAIKKLDAHVAAQKGGRK